MGQKGVLAAVGLGIAALVGAALWLTLGGGDSPEPEAPPPTDSAPAARKPEERAAEPRKRAGAGKKWISLGDGSVVGSVHEYGTERPLGGLDVTLAAVDAGPSRTLSTKTKEDGTFAFEDVPNFDDWLLRVDVSEPLADLELAGVGVVENRQTSLGVLYVTPAFSVPGIVVDEKGAPVAGAEVRALRARPAGAQLDILRLIRELPTDTPAVDKATTGPDGRFRLTKTPPGSYDFRVVARTFQIGIEKGAIVNPDAERREMRFVLSKGFEIDGRVVRKGPGTVEGINVVGFRQPQGEMDFLVLDRTFATTDAEGKFRLEGLGGGTYIVAATPEGEPFVVVDDVQVPSRSAVEIVLEGDAWVEGRVTGRGGAPVDGAQVYIAKFEGNPVVGTARTDAEGRYTIRGLRSGPVQLFLVQAEGYATWPQDVMSALMGGGGTAEPLQKGRNVRDAALEAGGVVRGTVRVQGTEEPIAGVRVELWSALAMLGGSRMATTGTDGKFEITSAPIGETVLLLSKDGWFQPGVNTMSLMMMLGGGRGGAKPAPDTGRGPKVSITEAGQTVERVLEMAKGSTVAGQVVSPAGEPVSGARVELVPESDAGGMMEAIGQIFRNGEPRLTDAEGRFEMPGPPPGQKMKVLAKAQGFLEGTSDAFAAKPGDRVEGVVAKLRQGGTIEGRVTDERGAPIEGALVKWLAKPEQDWGLQWQLRNARPTVTDADGRYRAAHVETGKVVVQFTHTRYLADTRTDVVLEEGRPVTLDAKLAAGKTLTGRVVGPDGKPVAGARVTAQMGAVPGQEQLDRYVDTTPDTTTDAQGAFTFEGLYPTSYGVRAESKGYAPSELVETTAGAESLTLRLQPALRVAGFVKCQGAPVANANVQVMRVGPVSGVTGRVVSSGGGEARSEVGEARTDAQGAFVVEDIPGGTYEIDVASRWGSPRANILPRTVKEVVAGTENLVIEVEPGLSIAGTVLLESGDPAAQGWVNVWSVSTDGKPVENPSNGWGPVEAGSFEIVGLRPGTYEVNVNVEGQAQRRVRAEAGTADLRIQLGAGGKITGRVLLPDGTAAAGCWVNAQSPEGGSGDQTDDQGAYEIKGLAPATYSVSAWAPQEGGMQGSAEGIDVRADQTTQVPDLTVRKP